MHLKLDIGPFVAQGVVLVEISQLREVTGGDFFVEIFFVCRHSKCSILVLFPTFVEVA